MIRNFASTIIATAVVLAIAAPVSAENLVLSSASRWLVVGSGESLEDAKAQASIYSSEPYGVRVVRSLNGKFATLLGPFGDPEIGALRAMKNIPSDAYLSTGTKMVATVWMPSWEKRDNVEFVAVGRDSSRCTSMPDPVRRLHCYDAVNKPDAEEESGDPDGPPTALEYAAFANALPAPTSNPVTISTPPSTPVAQPASGDPVTPVAQRLNYQGQDFEDGVMNDRIEMYLTYRNQSGKTVVGIRHRINVSNAFGDSLASGIHNLDMRLGPRQTQEATTFLVWEDNPFLRDQPFDKLRGPVANKTYKVRDEILKVVFDDGTVQEVSPE